MFTNVVALVEPGLVVLALLAGAVACWYEVKRCGKCNRFNIYSCDFRKSCRKGGAK